MFQEAPHCAQELTDANCAARMKRAKASASEVPAVCHWLCFLCGQRDVLGNFTWQSAERSQWQTAGTSEEETWRFLQCGQWALRGLPLPSRRLSVPVSRNFLNSLLTPFLVQLLSGNSSVNLLAVYRFKYKLFIKILSSSLNTLLIVNKHCSDVCSDEFPMPQIYRKSK